MSNKRKRPNPSRLPATIAVVVFALIVLVFLRIAWRKRAQRPSQPVSVKVLSPDIRAVPGAEVTPLLVYRHASATNVLVAGTWDRWEDFLPMERRGRRWRLDVRGLSLPLGRYEFKFLPNGEWEPGPNRVLFANQHGLLERPADLILSARLETSDRVDVHLRPGTPRREGVRVQFLPEVQVRRIEWIAGAGSRKQLGYSIAGDAVTFCMDEAHYGLSLPSKATVAVAGTFNGWKGTGKGAWLLEDPDGDGLWEGTFSLGGQPRGKVTLFKFVVNGTRWLTPPPGTLNAQREKNGNANLQLDPLLSAPPLLRITTAEPLALSNAYTVVVRDLADRPAFQSVTPGRTLDAARSDKPLGAVLDKQAGNTTYRLFAPRAKSVELHLADQPLRAAAPGATPAAGANALPMRFNRVDGTWELVRPGLDIGRYYSFRVDGPDSHGEGFQPRTDIGDPYARATAHAANRSIVIDPQATNRWFAGWSDEDYRRPAWEETVIYEAHVRDLTIHASSRVPKDLRGTFEGILATEGLGTGLDHLRQLGVNTIELLPVSEFDNGTNEYDWGYATAFFFAPEASYGRAPLTGSQYYEMKHLVNELHRRGFAVILDVVYNHIGGPNPFFLIDRKYYFRQDHEFNLSNFSGCGNDVRTEAPMMRRLVIDNVLYWMREFHIDGFRFDLAELIDNETLMAVRDAARELDPKVLLISEPWSSRRDHKRDLTGTGWAAWNNEFRDAVKHFARGHGDREALKGAIRGSVESWTANPMQSINYLESHDDMCLADELTEDPDHDAINLTARDAARNRLTATVLFTSLGIPMLAEGQEFLRSKRGVFNSYSHGDKINALRWTDRDRPEAAATQAYYAGLIRLRNSPAGAALRLRDTVPAAYFTWIEPSDPHALGYVVNAPATPAGPPLVVLLNAADRPVEFRVPFPRGQWQQVGDGRRLDPDGLADPFTAPPATPRRIRVPPLGAYMYAPTDAG